jgi:heme exporter protein D
MIWDSWSDFLDMGGYARYVWGSFVVVLAAVAIEQLMLVLQREDAKTAARLLHLRQRSKR